MAIRDFMQPSTGALPATESKLQESPIRISPINTWADDAQMNAKILANLRASPTFEQIDTFEGQPIYSADGTIFAFKTVVDTEQITFAVQWIEGQLPGGGNQFVTQVLVWRSPADPQGIATHTFWNILYPKHRAVMTDDAQTPRGERFWAVQTAKAMDKNIPVYGVNLRTHEAVRVQNPREFAEKVGDFYGREAESADLRLIITPHDISRGFKIIESKLPAAYLSYLQG